MVPSIIGAVRAALSLAVWAALFAVLTYFSDATHLNGFVNESLAAIIAASIGALEHSLESKRGIALFGAVRTR